MGHRLAGDGNQPDHPRHRVGQPGHPVDQQVAQRFRHRLGGRLRRRRAGRGQSRELDRVERVAAGSPVDLVQQLRRRHPAELGGEQLGGLGPGQRRQLEPAHARQPGQLRQERSQRMAPADIVGAVRGGEQQRHRPERPDQQVEQIPGGPVRPLQIVDHEHQRPVGGEPAQQRPEQLQQPPLATGFVAGGAQLRQQPQQTVGPGQQVGHRPRTAGFHQRAHDGGGRCQRQALGAERQAGGTHDPRAGRLGGLGQVLEQPGLPDPGLTADDHHLERAGPGGPQRLVELCPLPPAANQLPALHAGKHTSRAGRGLRS